MNMNDRYESVAVVNAAGDEKVLSAEIGKVRKRFRWTVLSGVVRILACVGIAAVMYICYFGIAEVRGNDMYPALRDGDVVIFYRNADYINSDVVLYETDGEVKAGRVQATYGSEIAVTADGKLTIDGCIQPIQTRAGIFSDTLVVNESGLPLTVGRDELYILGDNREAAIDSRECGTIDKVNVKGKIFTVIRRRAI